MFPQHAILEFFERTCDIFLICFYGRSNSTKNEIFWAQRELLGFSALCDLPETRFPRSKTGCVVSSWRKSGFSSFMRIPWGIYWHHKFGEILTGVLLHIKKLHFFKS